MRTLNKIAKNAQGTLLEYCQKLLTEIDTPLIGAELGSAYGGGVESIGKLWEDRGVIYGFDTFTGHPKQLAKNPKDVEASCMDWWYGKYPSYELSYEYQKEELDRQGLDNVILRKGLITKHSCDAISYLNYALLDLDMLASMKMAYEAVKDKITKDGYLFFHDVIPKDHLPELNKWFFEEIMQSGLWEIIGQWKSDFLVGVKRC